MELLAASLSALWLGVLTSIGPCPLMTNIAAISYIGRRVDRPRVVLTSGVLYALGRTLSYVVLAVLIVSSLLSMAGVSNFLQKNMNRLLGPILILAGMFLLELIVLKLPGGGVSEKMQQRVDAWGVWGASGLGILFALSFCPVSAALYFGALIPLSLQLDSRVVLPFVYGIGTALPVIGVAVALSAGAHSIGTAYSKLTTLAHWGRTVTGGVFILAGVYYALLYIFNIQLY